MPIFLQRSLISLACLAALSACSGGSDDPIVDTTFVVTSMSEVEADFQTFQLRELAYDGEVAGADDSRYVYKDRATDDAENSTEVLFNSESSTETQTEDLVITAITDINDFYSALSVEDVTIKVNGTNYTGDYVLIQDKNSGDLYPVVYDNSLLVSTDITSTSDWVDLHRVSNVADENRLYFDSSSTDILSVFELSGGIFTRIDTFDYSNQSFWVNEDGDILSQSSTDNNSMSWFNRSTSVTTPQTLTGPGEFLPFLYEGGFFATNTDDNKVYNLLTTVGGIFPTYNTLWQDVAISYVPASDSAIRNGYEMTKNCELYQLEDHSIIDKGDFSSGYGQLAVAGQDALFCVHATSTSSTALPSITQFNTVTQTYDTFTVSDGTLLDATTRFTVISDELVMFSEESGSSFEEYYINVVDNSEETIAVTEASIAILQTLSD